MKVDDPKAEGAVLFGSLGAAAPFRWGAHVWMKVAEGPPDPEAWNAVNINTGDVARIQSLAMVVPVNNSSAVPGGVDPAGDRVPPSGEPVGPGTALSEYDIRRGVPRRVVWWRWNGGNEALLECGHVAFHGRHRNAKPTHKRCIECAAILSPPE